MSVREAPTQQLQMSAPDASPPTWPGFHITRGTALRIPAGGLSISLDGTGAPKVELTDLQLRLDTSVHWMEIALEHLAQAKAAHEEMIAMQAHGSEVGASLETVFKASMQAIVCGATFFEALYAASRDCMPPGRVAPRSGDGSGAKRAAMVTEQLKRSFGLKQKKVIEVNTVLSEVYRFRDAAVHPSSSFGPPALHPTLGFLVEPRFAMFSYPNALQLVRAVVAYCKSLPSIGQKDGPAEVRGLAQYLLDAGQPHFEHWEKTYGPLFDQP